MRRILSALIAAVMLLLSGCHFRIPPKPGEETPPALTEAPAETTTLPPAEIPTEAPTEAPTLPPTEAPTEEPTPAPTEEPTEEPTPTPTEPPTLPPTEPPTEAPTEEPFERPMVNFADMVYERPDKDSFMNSLKALKAEVNAGKASDEEILSEAEEVLGVAVSHWNTMYALANINFTITPHNTAWAAEIEFFNQANPELETLLDELLVSCARSKYKDTLEEYLFGEGGLDQYADGPTYTEKIAKLMQQEAELVTRFESFDYENLVFTANGYTGTYAEIFVKMQRAGHSYLIDGLYDKYLEAVKNAIGEIFIELVKVRKAIAAEAGYASYEEFAFKEELERDYAPEDALKLAEGVKKIIVPVLENDLYSGSFFDEYVQYYQYPVSLSYGEVMEYAEKGLSALDGSLAEAFQYMQELDLCYLGYDEEQVGMSFTTFLFDYLAPYIVIQGSSDINDLITFIHEFGHFHDHYVNYGGNMNLDKSEVSSTALVLLMIQYLDQISGFNSQQRLAYRAEAKMSALDSLASQSMYYLFERKVYLLNDDELTVSAINEIARSTAAEFGLENNGFEDSWFMITHFYIQPFYVISYVTSSAISLQMYDKEIETKGSGLDLYMDYINSIDPYEPFTESVARLGLKSPFSDEGLEKLETIIKKLVA